MLNLFTKNKKTADIEQIENSEITNVIKKIEIAKEFVDQHLYDIAEWQPCFDDSDRQYLAIYEKLINEFYGEVRYENNQAQIEISSTDSHSRLPVIFDFEILK